MYFAPGMPGFPQGCCYPKPYPKEECENTVNINTSVSICQTANASGGDGGDGGYGGAAAGGSAAAASASGEDASAAASASSNAGGGSNGNGGLASDPTDLADPLDSETSTASATGGSATGGSGGEGGNGGIGGTASNSASVQVDNMVVICCDGKGPDQTIRLGMNDRKVEITVDKDGNTLVNGQKMDEQELENGTKVFIFRNSEAKKTEA